MSFFYDLNKRLADLATKQDAKQISEDAKATAPKSKLAESLSVAEAGYSAKAGRAGKDLGKPGKNFAKIAKSSGGGEKGQRIAGAVLNKLRHPNESIEQEGNEFTGALANAKKDHKSEFEVDGKKYKVVEAECPGCNCAPCKCTEGNAFTGKLKSTAKGSTFKLGDKEFKDTSDIEEGFKEMDAWLASREKEKGTGKFDRKERTLPSGMKATTYTRKHDDDAESDDEVKSDEPKKKGRPKGKAKGPERVTKGAWKHKGERKSKVKEDGTCPHCGGSLNDDELDEEKVEAGKREFFDRLAPAAKKAAKVIKIMSKGKEAVEEESTDKEDTKAEKAGKKVAKDIEYDEGHKGKDDNKAEKAGKKVTKDIEYDDKKDRKEKKEEKVDETTTSGSVATAPAAKKSSGSMQFGKGVYETFDKEVETMIAEGITVQPTMEECGEGMSPSITIQADGEEAAKLMMLLKLAGLEAPAEMVDENSPDWPTDTVTGGENDPTLQTYSGGLNKPKATGQTTIPVVASQLRRQVSMEENVELERSLFKLYKDISGK